MTSGPTSIWERLTGRAIYIWGAGQQGRGLAPVLQRNGLQVRGFLDSSAQLQGRTVAELPILHPALALAARSDGASPLVIIASFFFEEEIRESCRNLGLDAERDLISYRELKPFDYAVDISGACNLRCISCPRASRQDRHPPQGFMDAGTFELVLDKILREDPLVGSLQLYQWGEPLLNPQLPEILRLAHQRGVQCALSSNLNLKCDLAPIIEAGPAWFRVSVSGAFEQYEQTHTGASWTTLTANLAELARLRSALRPEMKAELYYHLYRDNQGESFQRVRELCATLDFEFHPVWAYLISLDDVLEHLEGKPLSPQAQEASALLALGLDEGMALARGEAGKECLVERCIHINWNLTVSHCMMFFYPQENIAVANFLETPLQEIQRARAACRLCRRCRAQALHRYCSVYTTERVLLSRDTP
jgi:hypothetical protein